MKKILSQAVKLEKDSPFKWVLLLLAYTGARRSEITRYQSLGITARYTHRVPLCDLINVIDNLEWL